jgi:hypothetical protein
MGTQPNPNDPLLPFGSNRCKCAACGEYFTSDPAKILDKDRKPRLRRTTSGHWASARRRVEYLDQE